MIPLVVASERGGWLNRAHGDTRRGLCVWCCGAFLSWVRRPERKSRNRGVSRSGLGWSAVDGESPVGENITTSEKAFPSSSGPVESAVNLPGPPGKPEYFLMTDSGSVP